MWRSLDNYYTFLEILWKANLHTFCPANVWLYTGTRSASRAPPMRCVVCRNARSRLCFIWNKSATVNNSRNVEIEVWFCSIIWTAHHMILVCVACVNYYFFICYLIMHCKKKLQAFVICSKCSIICPLTNCQDGQTDRLIEQSLYLLLHIHVRNGLLYTCKG